VVKNAVAAERPEHNPGNGYPRAQIEASLGKILASKDFRSSRRCSDFLKYIVAARLSGHPDNLKERTIAIDVFHRPAEYDPGEDATVRVTAGEVRKRLERYYANEGGGEHLRIELRAGSYVPDFVEPAKATNDRAHRSRQRLLIGLTAATAVLIILATATVFRSRVNAGATTPDILKQFWEPIFTDGRSILVSAAYVPVYASPKFGPEAPKTSRFVRLDDQFVGGGDLLTAARLAAMLASAKHNYDLKIGSDVSFTDLRTHPAVLIGYSYTKWKEISTGLRFTINADQQPPRIDDNGSPTAWRLNELTAERHTPYDYAIVTRVRNRQTGALLVVLAGITQYGTEAAGDLVTSPALLREALHDAPTGWQNENLQIVVRANVFAQVAAAPQAVATAFWTEKQ
jgi:hypothetical protein